MEIQVDHEVAMSKEAVTDGAVHLCRTIQPDGLLLTARQLNSMLGPADLEAGPAMTLLAGAQGVWVDGVLHCGACLREAEEMHSQRLGELSALYDRLRNQRLTDENAVQRRGLAFEDFIYELLLLFKLSPIKAFSRQTEQIDGGFTLDAVWLLEAKWWKEPVGVPHVAAFKDKIDRRPAGSRGVIISVSGVAKTVLNRYREHGAAFVVVDGDDIEAVLCGAIGLPALLRGKWAHLVQAGEVYVAASQLIGNASLPGAWTDLKRPTV